MQKVLVGGCFDILHFGHISFLKKARSLGNYLIVALESDENVRKLKGINRPFHSQNKRREMLMSLRFVDEVISLPEMKTDADYKNLVTKISPQIIATTKGDKVMVKKRTYAKEVNAKFFVLPNIKTLSTTQIAKLLKLE